MTRRFVVLDRDGTMIAERHYLSDPEQVELLPGAAEGLRRMVALRLGLIVVTNQSGIARGYFDLERVDAIHQRMRTLLAAEHVLLDGIYVCPHGPDDDCACRKPRAGLLLEAAAKFNFEPRECFVVGDKPCDIELGQGVGATTILVRTGYGREYESAGQLRPDHIVDDLCAAAELIAALTRRVET